MLTNTDVHELTTFRRNLHRLPEISHEEANTANQISTALRSLSPTEVITGLGGHGVAAVFDSGVPGPSVLFRAELDALPITETSNVEWSSEIQGKGHLCGHDGHMTILLGLGRLLARQPIKQGKVILMFQPAEEDGSGARAVTNDPKFEPIKPDWAFAIHNEPSLSFGHIATRYGLMNCASRGMKICFSGKTAHAAEPELAHTPTRAIATLAQCVHDFASSDETDDNFKLVTVTHINIGKPTFGITPGYGEIYLTLRTARDEVLAELVDTISQLTDKLSTADNLIADIQYCDDFAASINNVDAVDIARQAMDRLGFIHSEDNLPMRASEDFGIFGQSSKAAMLCLGPGTNSPALHHPDYDFNDNLIPISVSLFNQIAHDLLG